MIRALLVALVTMAVAAVLASWNDLLHLVAGAAAVVVLLIGAAVATLLRRRATPDDLDGYLDEEELGQSRSGLREGLGGVLLGGVGLAVGALIYSYALPPLYPLLVGDCPQLLPKLDIYEEASAWPQAVALIDARLARPLDPNCQRELAVRKTRYLIEWSKTLPRDQAVLKLQEAERWADENELADYRTIAQLMRDRLNPTPSPSFVTPTPTPAPTPRPLPAGSIVEISGMDTAYFPPTIFAYLRVVDGAGQAITDLAPSDVRVEDDGRLVSNCSLSHFSRAPAPICAALAIDYSGSMEGEPLAAAKAGARAFLGLLGSKDQVAVIGFSDEPQLVQAWTADTQLAAQSLDLLPAKDWTALWDALWLAGEELSGKSGRKAVIVLTDGADNRSQHTPEEVIEQAQRVGLSIFAIGLRSEDYDGAALQRLVKAVGGRYVEAGGPGELEAYYREMAGAIHDEYRLALSLERQPDAGTHQLTVRVGGPQPLVAVQGYEDSGP
jgi:VWFA-related protein